MQRLEGWKGVLGQYRYTICHIPGDRNAWDDLLSCWVSVPALPVRAVAVFGSCDQDDSMPPNAVVRQAQQKALATDGAEVKSFESAVGLAVLDDEGLFCINARGKHVLWISDSDKQLQVRLMICAHMRDAGHRGVAATLVCLQECLSGQVWRLRCMSLCGSAFTVPTRVRETLFPVRSVKRSTGPR